MYTEYNDKQELEQEIKDDGKNIETLAEEQQEHQGDLEKMQEAVQMLKNSKGLYAESDRTLQNSVETAIQARDTNVEICKEKIGTVKTGMEGKLEKLKHSIDIAEKRIDRMEEAAESLKHRDDGVVSKIEATSKDHRNEIEDAKHKVGLMSDIISLSAQIANVVNVTADAIGQIVDALKSLGLMGG